VIRHKYHAVRTERHGLKFDSKAEASYYDTLLLRKLAGEVLVILVHVPFALPGGTRYVCDFLVFEADGTVRFIDVKGVKTAKFVMQKKIVEELYAPIVIEVVEA
jgi:hypothetical protein